jgi:4-hydroxy-2-oxoheptanedioate aldolase
MTPADFAARVRNRVTVIGYWVVADNPVGTERLARAGYDYVVLDAQHGLMGYQGVLTGLLAIDASNAAAGVVRVEANIAGSIGKALDAGAVAVIVPLINTADDAAAAVAAARYPPEGIRSYGPMRSGLRIGPAPAEANVNVLVFAMIETPQGLAEVEEIAATPGLDGLYIGPSDLTLALGGKTSTDPSVAAEFDGALQRILRACEANGIVPGIHTSSGAVAKQRIAAGFRFVSVASDLTHLEESAQSHLAAARGA